MTENKLIKILEIHNNAALGQKRWKQERKNEIKTIAQRCWKKGFITFEHYLAVARSNA